jgi:serine/threonine protein kinase
MLGEGGFGFVELCTLNQGGAKRKVAVKRFHESILTDDTCLKLLCQEIETMATIQHAHMIKFIGIGARDCSSEEGIRDGLFIVQESCFGGTLKQAINAHKDTVARGGSGLTTKDLMTWAIQLASALAFLHSQAPPIIHRDIKLDNILLVSPLRDRKSKEEIVDVRLIDFGLACPLTKGDGDASHQPAPGHIAHGHTVVDKISAAFSRVSHTLIPHHPMPDPHLAHMAEGHQSSHAPEQSARSPTFRRISSAFSRLSQGLTSTSKQAQEEKEEHIPLPASAHDPSAPRVVNHVVFKDWDLDEIDEEDEVEEASPPALPRGKSSRFSTRSYAVALISNDRTTSQNEAQSPFSSAAAASAFSTGILPTPSPSTKHPLPASRNPSALAASAPSVAPAFNGPSLQIHISTQREQYTGHHTTGYSPTMKRVVTSERLVSDDLTNHIDPNLLHLHMGPVEITLELSGQTGSFLYMSPEVYKAQPYNEKADVFSFAIVLHEILHRKVLMFHVFDLHPSATDFSPAAVDKMLAKYAELVAHGHRPPMDTSIPHCLSDLIVKCWAQKASDRPSMAQVVSSLERIVAEEDLHSLNVIPREMPKGCCG